MITRTLLLLCSTGALLLAADQPARPWNLDEGKITRQAIAGALRNLPNPPPLTLQLELSDKATLAANTTDGRCAVPLLLAPVKDASKFSMQKLETGNGKFDAMAVKPMPVCTLP
jgi:hypothetical protein